MTDLHARWPYVAALVVSSVLLWVSVSATPHASTPGDYRFGYDAARAFVDGTHYTHAPLHGARHDCAVMRRIAHPTDVVTFTRGCDAGYAHEVAVWAPRMSA